MMSLVLDSFTSFLMSHDPVTVTVTYVITLTPSSKFQHKNKIKIKIRKKLNIIRVYYLQL